MIANILRAKFEAIDTECENAVRTEVNKLYEMVQYDGTKLCVPSFQAAGELWLALIKKKEQEFVREIARVSAIPSVTVKAVDAVATKKMIEDTFADSRYLDRMHIFHEGIARKARSHGLVFDAKVHCIDSHESAYRAGAINALHIARSNAIAEFELHRQSSTPESFRSLFRGWHYFVSHPLKFFAVGFFLMLAFVISKVGFSDIMQWLRYLARN